MARTDRWLVNCHIVRLSQVADYLLSLQAVPRIWQEQCGYVGNDLYSDSLGAVVRKDKL